MMNATARALTTGLRAMTYNAQQLLTRNFHSMLSKSYAPTSTTVPANQGIVTPMAVQVGSLQRLLSPFNSLLTQVAGFKVKARLKRRCKDCYIVVRQQRSYVICPTHPRHKQMSMKKRDYKSWILTHATQSKERPY